MSSLPQTVPVLCHRFRSDLGSRVLRSGHEIGTMVTRPVLKGSQEKDEVCDTYGNRDPSLDGIQRCIKSKV